MQATVRPPVVRNFNYIVLPFTYIVGCFPWVVLAYVGAYLAYMVLESASTDTVVYLVLSCTCVPPSCDASTWTAAQFDLATHRGSPKYQQFCTPCGLLCLLYFLYVMQAHAQQLTLALPHNVLECENTNTFVYLVVCYSCTCTIWCNHMDSTAVCNSNNPLYI